MKCRNCGAPKAGGSCEFCGSGEYISNTPIPVSSPPSLAGSFLILILGVGSALAISACGDTTYNYFAPSQVVNQQGQTPNPSASASPSPGTGVVRTVRVGEFGEQCPANSGLQPAESAPRQVRAGCTSAVTCTPLDAQGRQIPAQIPPRLDSFGVVAGEDNVIVEPFEDNAYNVSVFGRRANTTATLRCVVEGVPSPDWVIQVVP